MARFGVRLAESVIPTAEITVPLAVHGPYRLRYTVVKRRRGFTQEHALRRAYKWTREHGDTR